MQPAVVVVGEDDLFFNDMVILAEKSNLAWDILRPTGATRLWEHACRHTVDSYE